MKRVVTPFLFILALLTFCQTSFATIWYVRADGGTRYSANRVANGLSAQCNGKYDAPYSGDGGTNENCAFNDFRSLYDDQATYGVLQWVIAGGDTILIDNTKQWRVGWDGDTSQTSGWCSGSSGGPYGCFNPTIPAGSAAQPTRILGRNYASCSLGNASDRTKMTQLFGGHGAYVVLNLTATQNVQVECLELTRHSNCAVHGSPLFPSDCHTPTADGGIQDYDSDGIITNQQTSNILLQDIWDHGHTDRGIIGPIGGLITATRVDIDTNGEAGWDFDDGSSTPSVNGTLKMTYSTIEWNGCNQEYPAVHAIPVASCYDQNSGGYGDGIGSPTGTGLNVSLDHDIFRYNTQDGEDFGHVDTGNFTLSVTNSASYGNMGGQYKWGPAFSSVTVENNLAMANCFRMQQQMTGVPSTYNQYLSDFCRAGDAISFVAYNGNTSTIANNTVVSYSPTTIDMQCGTQNGAQSCANTTFNFSNNIFRGYDNPITYPAGGQVGGPGLYCGASCNSSTALIGTIHRLNNNYYGFRGSCQANQLSYASNGTAAQESCTDPGFVAELPSFTTEAALDNYNFTLSPASPLLTAGVSVSDLAADFDSNAYKNPPSVGALQSGSQATLTDVTLFWSAPQSVTTVVAAGPAKPLATITAAAGQSYSKPTQTVNVTVTVRDASGKVVPTGTVVLKVLGIKVLPANLVNGSASWSLPAAVEAFGFSASFAGNSTYAASASSTVTILASK